jgi:EpsI family protein
MKHSIQNWCILALMLASAAMASVMKPNVILAESRSKVDLEQNIPQQFGEWRVLQQSTAQFVNPQQTELLNKLYSQILTRTYVHPKGGMIMLSIAYGANQSDGLALHYPDVCYPAQGFQVKLSQKSDLKTTFGQIRVNQLNTQLGNRREPLTYWSTVGDHVVQGGTEAKLAQLSYGFKGQIPDGLIFRVSSLSGEPDSAYRQQEIFVNELLAAVSPEMRRFLIGNSSAAPTFEAL